MQKNKSQTGYIALASMLVIMVVVLVIGTSVALLSISNTQLSLSQNLSSQALDQTEGCVVDALLRLNENNALPSSITLPGASCSVTIDTQSGSNWIFTVSSTHESYYRSIQLDIDRTGTISINSWKEL